MLHALKRLYSDRAWWFLVIVGNSPVVHNPFFWWQFMLGTIAISLMCAFVISRFGKCLPS